MFDKVIEALIVAAVLFLASALVIGIVTLIVYFAGKILGGFAYLILVTIAAGIVLTAIRDD